MEVSTNYKVTKIKNGIFPSNTYILTDTITGQSIIIDPGLDMEALKKAEYPGFNPIAVLATHGHFDHIGHVSYYQKRYQIPFSIHEDDLKILKSANFLLKIAKINVPIETPKPDFTWSGSVNNITIGNFQLRIIRLPGHTPGSCIITTDNLIFSGDTIYKNGLGFNHFPGEDKTQLRNSIRYILETFKSTDIIHPGHGSITNIEEIKEQNIELQTFLQINES